MSDPKPPADPRWPRGFDEHAMEQRLRLGRLPLADKLDWLEEAHRIILAIQRRPR